MTSSPPMLKRTPRPLYPTRIMNLVGTISGRVRLDPAELLAAACKSVHLEDWGEDEFREGLEVFCQAVNEDQQMHHTGRLMARKMLHRWLRDRLLIQQTVAAEPKILERPVDDPILIPGSPRSGTTLLHRLLALDDQFRTTRSWELYFPTPPPDPATYHRDPRIAKTVELYRLLWRVSPALRAAHPMTPELPEECWYLLDRTLLRPLYTQFFDIPRYQEWMASRTSEQLQGAYRYHKKQIQILQWRFPQRRWLLKSPVHGYFLDAFQRVYPDARYVFCHRDPKETIPSASSLFAARKSAYYSRLDLHQIGAKALEFISVGLNRAMDARQVLGEERCFDLSFRAFMEAPIETVRAVYAQLGLVLAQKTETRMRDYLASQRVSAHSRHSYTQEQFGLSAVAVDAATERYRERYHDFF
jgi:Sulfotransferase family